MRFNETISLILICLLTGCSIFNKDKSPKQSELSPSSVNTNVADSSAIPTDYSTSDTDRLTDTILIPEKPKLPLEYMTIEEKAMVEEINLLRADPNAYIQYVDAYLQEFFEDDSFDSATKQNERYAVEELIRALRYQAPLPMLAYNESLYDVAKMHGEDMKSQGLLSHRGTDGLSPVQRIQDNTSLTGSENLVGGGRSVRESIIMLLVDANDRAGRSHRKALLSPGWEYVACYSAGTINETHNTWVQLFGLNDPNDVPKEEPLRTVPEEAKTSPDTVSEEQENTKPAMSGDISFMTTEEKAMIDEINLMRSNPKAYIKYVDAYVTEMKEIMIGGTQSMEEAANELKDQLNNMSALSKLKPHSKLYDVAKAHGLDNKRHNQLEHKGSDGRQSFDRVKQAGLKNSINSDGVYAPNENLVGGENNVRNAVIALLIDDGIPTRGHRKALIEPTWQYVACFKIGTIKNLKDLGGMDDMDNCWVQFFAIQ